MDFGGGDQIRFERIGMAAIVTLTRPKALNAVTHQMVKALTAALKSWEDDPAVALVLIRGEGRAFSAGGDIMHIYETGRTGNPPVDFFADEYRLNAAIARFAKPYVALIDGIVMGGGVGISFHGSHRVVTENAQFAMPEVGIGFFPDVGGSFLLPRLRGNFGVYLGLTGKRIRWGDIVWSELATHAVDARRIPDLVAALATSGDVDAELDKLCRDVPRETDDARIHFIARHFGLGSVADIVASLKHSAASDDFAAETLATMLEKSPTSLEVTFRELSTGLALSMDECMRVEFRIVNRMLAGHDFYEGIRAAIIDKGTKPEWRPATLDAVDTGSIEAYFRPLAGGELVL
jgi:enoyl-CoA hydratase/carnithine racemase